MALVIASQLDPEWNAQLAQLPFKPKLIDVDPERPWESASQADVLLVSPMTGWRGNRDMPRPASWPGRLRWVYSSSTGIDYYPDWLLDAPLVSCGRGIAADEIADYVIAAIYARAKNLEAVTARSRADWRQAPLGRVSGTTVGLVGLGAIGTEVARRAIALGAEVIAVRRSRDVSSVPRVTLLDSVEAVVASADHIVIAAPATAETHHLFNRALFEKVRPGAHLINIARGSIVDQDALLEALDSGRLDFATLDVTDPEPLPEGHPLYTHERVRLTPHVSGNYLTVRHRQLDKIIEDISRFARGELPRDVVDPQRGY